MSSSRPTYHCDICGSNFHSTGRHLERKEVLFAHVPKSDYNEVKEFKRKKFELRLKDEN